MTKLHPSSHEHQIRMSLVGVSRLVPARRQFAGRTTRRRMRHPCLYRGEGVKTKNRGDECSKHGGKRL